MGKYYYRETQSSGGRDFEIDGIVVLGDLETFGDVGSARVIVFEDSSSASEAIDKLNETEDVDYAFKAALAGDAEEISVEKLVRFYLENT